MRIEEEHPDVLQNIEFMVVQHYRDHPETTDYDVMRVYEALTDFHAAENIGRQPRVLDPKRRGAGVVRRDEGDMRLVAGQESRAIHRFRDARASASRD